MSDKPQWPLVGAAGGDDNGLGGQRAMDLAVGAWLGAHACLRPAEIQRMSWEWVSSDGNRNPDRAAVVRRPVEESKAFKMGEYDETVIIDNVRSFGYAHSISPRAASLACWKSSGKLFTGPLPSSESKRPFADTKQGEDGKPRDQCDATPKVSCHTPDVCVFGASPTLRQALERLLPRAL